MIYDQRDPFIFENINPQTLEAIYKLRFKVGYSFPSTCRSWKLLLSLYEKPLVSEPKIGEPV